MEAASNHVVVANGSKMSPPRYPLAGRLIVKEDCVIGKTAANSQQARPNSSAGSTTTTPCSSGSSSSGSPRRMSDSTVRPSHIYQAPRLATALSWRQTAMLPQVNLPPSFRAQLPHSYLAWLRKLNLDLEERRYLRRAVVLNSHHSSARRSTTPLAAVNVNQEKLILETAPPTFLTSREDTRVRIRSVRLE